MTYDWQQANWPEFTYDAKALQTHEETFLHNSGILRGSIKHIDESSETDFIIELMSEEAYRTSEIEGDILDRASLQSSIKQHFGLKKEQKSVRPAEQGIADLLMDIYKTYDHKLTKNQLCEWHAMLMRGRRDLLDIGRFRTHEDPMQIIPGALGKQKMHFEAPPSIQLPGEMKRFIKWFNDTQKSGIKPLARAGLAHLYFESIHPFEDGNGRIGRAISEKALSQSLACPTLIALSHVIIKERKIYYNQLQKNSFSLEIMGWLECFSTLILSAQDHTQNLIDFMIKKSRFFDLHADHLNDR